MSLLIAPLVILIRIILLLTEQDSTTKTYKVTKTGRKQTMKWTLFKKNIHYAGNLFNGHFVDVKAFYTAHFKQVACVTFVSELDINKAYALIKNHYAADIISTYQHNYFDHEAQQIFFNNTILVLGKNRMIEISVNYCQLLYGPGDYNWAGNIAKQLATCKADAGAKTKYDQSTQYTRVLGFAGATELN